MNIPLASTLSQSAAQMLIAKSKSQNLGIEYRKEKHQLVIERGQEWLAKIYLPWNFDWSAQGDLKEKPDSHFGLVLMRAGQAVTGYFHGGELIDHKVFRAYMVRQKQGKSQIKHLKTKGKSRAGSRIRLAETEQFFEEINERLNSYAQQFPVDFWGISCAKTMWPYFFSSAVAPPFSSKDEKLIELPVHIAQASFEKLKMVGELLRKFQVIFSESGRKAFETWNKSASDMDPSEDW